jgi:N-acetylglucosamine-6-phosphate deacetylase
MAAAGLKEGTYELGGLPVFVKNGAARLKNGTLAGSTLTQDRALVNMVKIGIPSEDVIAMLTGTPAREIGVDGYKGRLQKGYDADINILDNEYQVKATFVKGNEVTV